MTTSNNTDAEVNKKEYNFDQLQMYFRYPYKIEKDEFVWNIKQPKIRDIINIGEKTFYSTLYTFIGNTTMFRVNLWDMKPRIDWCEISDYQLFYTMIKAVNKEVTDIFFDDIDFSTFDLYEKNVEDKKEMVLYSKEHNLMISEDIYLEMREYLRTLFNIYPKVEFGRNKATKIAIIEDEKTKAKIAELTGENKQTSTLLPLISFAINHPGFKYKLDEVMDLGIYQFMDSIQRLNVYESTRALYTGMYSGFCDLSKQLKSDPDLLNFAKDLSHKEEKQLDNNNNNETSK